MDSPDRRAALRIRTLRVTFRAALAHAFTVEPDARERAIADAVERAETILETIRVDPLITDAQVADLAAEIEAIGSGAESDRTRG